MVPTDSALASGSDPVRPRPNFYVPQLDALRFIAFFLVFLHHNLPTGEKLLHRLGPTLQSGFILVRDVAGFGLSLFFFLSSYLIASLLIMEKASTATVDLRAFYVRRILRIWPLYFTFLGAVALTGIWFSAEHVSVPRLGAMVFLAGNWYSIAAGMGPFVIAPLWSISVEEQFYAIWPSVFRLLSKRTFVIFSVVVAIFSLASTAILASRGASSLDLWMNSLSEFIFFAAGSLLAHRFNAMQKPNLLRAILLMSSGVVLWFITEILCKIDDRGTQALPILLSLGYLFIAVGCALLIMGALSIPARAIPEWLRYLGKISYGLYVFHALSMHLVRSAPLKWHLQTPGFEFVVILAITLAMADLSYRFLEKPFLRLKRRFEVVVTRSA